MAAYKFLIVLVTAQQISSFNHSAYRDMMLSGIWLLSSKTNDLQ